MRTVPTAGLIALVAALAPVRAHAHGAAPRPMEASLSDLPPGPIKRALFDVRAALAKSKLEPALIDRPVRQALRAMERARNARAAGDFAHAALLEAVAGEWTGVAQLLVRAAEEERAAKAAADDARKRADAVQRAQALLGEQQARRGRLQAQVAEQQDRIEKEKHDSAEREKNRILGKSPKRPRRKHAPGSGRSRKKAGGGR